MNIMYALVTWYMEFGYEYNICFGNVLYGVWI